MHLKRWITSLVAIPLLVLIISIGGTLWLAVVINVICIMALWEYFCMVLNKDQYVKAASFQILALISGTAVGPKPVHKRLQMRPCHFLFGGCSDFKGLLFGLRAHIRIEVAVV